MVLVKILKRKDASSVIVAVTVGILLVSLVTAVTSELASKISGLNNSQYASTGGWKATYLLPAVAFVLELIALEILGWIYVLVGGSVKK
jgi:hypothetical protein